MSRSHPAAGPARGVRPAPSILNDVLGPVMRGPSSSHTAGSFHIGSLAVSVLGSRPMRALVTFDRSGSYGQVFREQGADRAFAAAFAGWPLTDARFDRALEHAAAAGLDLRFEIGDLDRPDHPNAVDVQLWDRQGTTTRVRAKSVGGGAVEVTSIDGWRVGLCGQAHCLLVEVERGADRGIASVLQDSGGDWLLSRRDSRPGAVLLTFESSAQPTEAVRTALAAHPRVRRVRALPPIGLANTGVPLFSSAGEMLEAAAARRLTLGRIGVAYESQLLGLPDRVLLDEMLRRFGIMRDAVERGLREDHPRLQLLEPAAARVMAADLAGRLPIGGLHARAAARAMAVMHVNGSMGVVCAAPTGGSAGVLPGVLATLVDERGLSLEDAALSLFAASSIGVVVASRATFAAEVAGCQVEIGAAAAMAAAAVVEATGGTAVQCADAAAVAFQNGMGSVCDLVQGRVEIPCHTRNAAAASSAFVCADLVVGGYRNPISLDDTIDAVLAVGRMMPPELRCTAKGGLAVTPSAKALGSAPRA